MAKAQFDRNEVIENAIRLFWQHGYSASSMQQVVKATGLQPGSIYLAFKNKEGLYREALDAYAANSKKRIKAALEGPDGMLKGICTVLESMIEQSTKEDYNSCFLIKTQLELAAEGNSLHELASEKLDEIEALFRSYLEQEFDTETARKRAASIMVHIFGLRVYGYKDNAAERMRESLRQGLPWLPWNQTGS
ncbi:TetR/AcrR family transcriptional regulator [Verrucomicrobia bacterium S94]|nr:TetR/AcrR family transcriptional regulator [Verrucomicrobia bacterium S94]